jgi:hypothetical protein
MRATHPARLIQFWYSRFFLRCAFPSALALILFCDCATVRAADWPPIVPAELAMKDNPAEPGADAMILYREQIADGTKASESIYCRIKVFTEEGKKYADIEIPFFKRSGDIRDVQGRTIHPDGQAIEFDGKVLEKTVVKAGSIKELVKSITLPDVTPGSIIEYRYKIQRDTDYIYNVYWRVQEGLYTKHAHFLFKPYESVGAPLPPMFFRLLRLQGLTPQKQKNGTYTLDVNDLAGVPEEEYMLPVAELRGSIEFVYSWDPPTPNAEDYWNAVGKRVFAEDAGFIGKRGAIKQAADEAIGSASTPEEKLRLLYVRAQQLKNTQIDAGEKTPQEMKRENQKDNKTVEDVLKRGYGSYDDINRLFVAFVQAEGFEAQRVFGTLRTNGIFHMALQDQRELDDDFVWIHLGDKDVFVDPSVALCPYGMLPWYETAIKVLRPTKQGAVFMDVPVTDSSLTVTDRNANLSVDEQGNVTGTFVVTFTGDRALSWRQEGRTKDEEARRKMMKDEVKQWFPIDTKIDITAIKNWDVTDKPLSVECKIETNGILQSAGHRVLMPVSLYTSGRPQMLQHDARKQPVFFALPYEETDEIRIQVPLTWRLESLPTRKRIDPGAHFLYEISSIQQGGFLEIKRRFSIGQQIYPVEQYATLRHIFGSVKADDEQQVVFQTQGGSSGGN